MVIEVHHIGSRFPADSLSPGGSGDRYRQVLLVDYTLQVIYHPTVPRMSDLVCCQQHRTLLLPFLALLCLIPVGLVLRLAIES